MERPDRYGKDIQIADKAFERVFDYFDQYQWHLDERPLRADNEINPDVLGYIFEKYINQKQMGAYYTKEDITEYISKSTVIPFLFNAARARCKVAFENPDGPTVWDLLRETPDRYIYPAVRHGLDKPLPPHISAGLDTAAPRPLPAQRGNPILSGRLSWIGITILSTVGLRPLDTFAKHGNLLRFLLFKPHCSRCPAVPLLALDNSTFDRSTPSQSPEASALRRSSPST